jgi:glycosyltransferase involved in cell wall biosynthesis
MMRMRTNGGPATVMYVANAAKIGGGNRVLIELVRFLDPDRFRPVVIAPAEGPLTEWARQERLDYRVLRAGDWESRAGLLRRAAALLPTMIAERVRLVHSMAPMSYRAAGAAGRLLRVPRICHLGFPPHPGELEYAFSSPPELVIACYDGQAREVAPDLAALRPTPRIVSVPNGVDTTTFAPSSVRAALAGLSEAEGRRPDRAPVVLIVGHLSDVKGYPEFLEAAARVAREIPDCTFAALGGETITSGYRAQLERRAEELGIRSRVQFLGFRDDVADVIRSATVVVLPSLAEGFPLALLEAMACGKPIVATPVGGVPEAVIEGVTGKLVPVHDPAALAGAVLDVLRSPALSERLGRAARDRAEAEYSVERVASRIQSLYDELLTGSTAASLEATDAQSRI